MAKNQVVAIDIGTTTVKMIYIENISGVLHLMNVGVMELNTPDDPQRTSEVVRELWNQIGVKQNIFNKHKIEIAIALPRGSVVTKNIPNLPPATPDDQLPAIVDMAAETELPFQTVDSIYTYHDIQRTTDSLSVELVSTRRDMVTRYMDSVNATGATPSAVIPSMLGISTAAQDALADTVGRTIIVDIGGGHTDFCLMEGNKLLFSRGIALGGNQLTRTISAEMDIETETAEQEKQHISANQPPTRAWTRRFISEIERSVAAANRELNEDTPTEITEIWLCGGGARVPDLAETCQEQLQIPTRLWNPMSTITLDTTQIATTKLDAYADTLAVPLGVALHTLNVEKPVSLLPTEVGVKRVESSRKHRQLIAAGIIGFILLAGVIFGITLSRTQKSKVDLLNRQLADFQRRQVNANKQLTLELILADKLTHQISPIDILNTLSTLFKDRTKVAWTTFEVSNLDDLQKTRINFNLKANSYETINSMIGSLKRTELFSQVETGEIVPSGDQRNPTYEAKINCRLGPQVIQKYAQRRHPKPIIEITKEEPVDVEMSPPKGNVEESKEDNR